MPQHEAAVGWLVGVHRVLSPGRFGGVLWRPARRGIERT
ncbi:hypothetical protein AVV12_gp33 [Streptomyces phage SF3]|uniref:Uncharacterized protein n=1 Tax=Streptomyces phage SF3 TaxID=1690818 RepID=A0A0M4S3E0_9CAUD|nr:hypothetical protein AVV12_gp33 [Streptomyces phage SF3]ALF00164.1 hypothetical protein SF3_330 [Streptomyces phage SF3]